MKQVSSNKVRIEGKLVHALESISDRLSGFKILNACFHFESDHEKKLRRKILLAHLAFIDLALEMTKYYILPAYRNIAHHILAHKYPTMLTIQPQVDGPSLLLVQPNSKS